MDSLKYSPIMLESYPNSQDPLIPFRFCYKETLSGLSGVYSSKLHSFKLLANRPTSEPSYLFLWKKVAETATKTSDSFGMI